MKQEIKNCQNCKKDFVIEPDDFLFYEKIKVPPPTFCPDCRMQRRLSWRNERVLCKRECDLCKCNMLAIYPKDAHAPVYCSRCWFSDDWDGTIYGQEYDFNKPFFEQFHELQNKVPRLGLQAVNCIKCDYANAITHSKNCYLCFSTANSEDSMYSMRIMYSKNMAECYLVDKSENCFDSVNCQESSYLRDCENCAGSFDLSFCNDMRGSSNCFLSSLGRQSTYVFENQQLPKEEYQKRIKEIDFGSFSRVKGLQERFDDLKKSSIHKYAQLLNTNNVTGDFISNARNCRLCFYGTEIENCAYSLFIEQSKDSMDVCYGCCQMELMYEVSSAGVNAANVKFSKDTWPDVQNSEYLDSCRNGIDNCFGCVSLRKKKYCILNKEYSKEEYDVLVAKIKQHMNEMPFLDKAGKTYAYGEFFPTQLSPHAYNETTAQVYYPLQKNEALGKGYNWKESEIRTYTPTCAAKDLPDNINDVEDSVVNQIIECEHNGKCTCQCTEAYKITSDELLLYRSKKIPLPRFCPNCRASALFEKLPKPKLYNRKCMNAGCQNEFQTSYAPDRPEKVYCESCYNKEIL